MSEDDELEESSRACFLEPCPDKCELLDTQLAFPITIGMKAVNIQLRVGFRDDVSRWL